MNSVSYLVTNTKTSNSVFALFQIRSCEVILAEQCQKTLILSFRSLLVASVGSDEENVSAKLDIVVVAAGEQ